MFSVSLWLMNGDRIHLGMALNASNTSLNRAKEVLFQARLLALLLIVGGRHIIVSIRRENYALNDEQHRHSWSSSMCYLFARSWSSEKRSSVRAQRKRNRSNASRGMTWVWNA